MNDKLHAMRHSAAHVLAAVIQKNYPSARFGVGPVIDHGFYYDVKLDETLSDKDLKKLQSEMRKMIGADLPMERLEWGIEEAISYFEEHNQPYKVELLKDLQQHGTTKLKDFKNEDIGVGASDEKITTVTIYRTGDFVDLCKGPHVESTSQIGVIKLQKLAGAYWRGDEKRDQLQRVYGLAFATEEDLNLHLERLVEAVKRDHRKLGRELDLFAFSDLVGAGLPLFTPRGTVLRDQLSDMSQRLRVAHGFEKVWIPHITKRSLYETSGHWAKFGDELFLVKSQETSDEMVLKPMNCPHHTQIYASRPRSYRDLPVRYFETTTVYRDEKAGEMSGLSRVRSITQDDSHTFCREDQLDAEIGTLVHIVKEFYGALQLPIKARLSFRDDGDGYLGEMAVWEHSQQLLTNQAQKHQLDYFIAEGEAAFYGPKIDFLTVDALGRELQVATIQLDKVMPERFALAYTAEDGSSTHPLMIHFALLGSIERFLATYIEHTAGAFPVWLAPEQVRVIPVSEKSLVYAQNVEKTLRAAGVRVALDASNESLGKRIRAGELYKVPYLAIVGEQESVGQTVAVRSYQDGDLGASALTDFVDRVRNESTIHIG